VFVNVISTFLFPKIGEPGSKNSTRKNHEKKNVDLMSWELESSTLSQTAAVNCCADVTKSHQQIQ
jgi:hypothetical protein